MEFNQNFLDKTIYWLKLRCYGNVKAHSDNVMSFLVENGELINGGTKVQVAFSHFRNLTNLHDELCEIEPDRSLRFLYDSLGFAIITEDYVKAEKCKDKILKYNKNEFKLGANS